MRLTLELALNLMKLKLNFKVTLKIQAKLTLKLKFNLRMALKLKENVERHAEVVFVVAVLCEVLFGCCSRLLWCLEHCRHFVGVGLDNA